jgi:hypothetical protein
MLAYDVAVMGQCDATDRCVSGSGVDGDAGLGCEADYSRGA